MNLSAADQQALQAMFQGASNISWSTLLGAVTLGQPSAGSPTLKAIEDFGQNGAPGASEHTLQGQLAEGLLNNPNGENIPTQSLQEAMGYTYPGLDYYGAQPTLGGAQFLANAENNYEDQFGYAPVHTNIGGTGTLANDYGAIVGSGSNYDRPTLANQENYSSQFGRQGSFGAGTTAGSPLTIAAQKQYMDAILNAPKGPADTFSYLAKERAMQDAYNPVAQLLGSNMQAATGASMQALQAAPALTNTQLAADLVASQNGGTVSPATQAFLSRVMGVTQPGQVMPAGSSANAAGNGALQGGTGTTDVIGQLIAALHQSQPANPMGSPTNYTNSPMAQATGLPTGFETSMQQFNKLAPSAQSAYTDLQQTLGGENPTDFLAGMKQSAGSFNGAATGGFAHVSF